MSIYRDLSNEDLPEEEDYQAETADELGDKVAALEPLRSLTTAPEWPAMLTWTEQQEAEALEGLVESRTHETSLVWRARIQLLRQIHDLALTTKTEIAQLSDAIESLNGEE